MTEEGAEMEESVVGEAVGRLEPNPTNPEVKEGEIGITIYVTSDYFIYINPKDALEHEVSLAETRTK